MVSRMAEPSENGNWFCTNPLPKDRRPMMIPRSLSCIAPAKISLADADHSSIRTTIWASLKAPLPFDIASLRGNALPSVYTMSCPWAGIR